MSKDLRGPVAAAITLIDDHCRQHGRDMYGDCLGLREVQAVLRQCAAALKPPPPAPPEPQASKPEPPKTGPVSPQAAVKPRGTAGG